MQFVGQAVQKFEELYYPDGHVNKHVEFNWRIKFVTQVRQTVLELQVKQFDEHETQILLEP